MPGEDSSNDPSPASSMITRDASPAWQCFHIYDSAVQIEWDQSSGSPPSPPLLYLAVVVAARERNPVTFEFDMVCAFIESQSLAKRCSRTLFPPHKSLNGVLSLPPPGPLIRANGRRWVGSSRYSVVDMSNSSDSSPRSTSYRADGNHSAGDQEHLSGVYHQYHAVLHHSRIREDAAEQQTITTYSRQRINGQNNTA